MKTNEVLQWAGAVFIVLGHSLNSVGPGAHPWNILAFLIGTVLFLSWTVRVGNRPQMMVNTVSMALGVVGVANALI